MCIVQQQYKVGFFSTHNVVVCMCGRMNGLHIIFSEFRLAGLARSLAPLGRTCI